MAVPARITIITLGVADLARATAFYQAMGWTPTPYSTEEITFIETSGSMLALFPTDELAADAGLEPPTSSGFRGVTTAINVVWLGFERVRRGEGWSSGGKSHP